jgi:hypothetical protein
LQQRAHRAERHDRVETGIEGLRHDKPSFSEVTRQ